MEFSLGNPIDPSTDFFPAHGRLGVNWERVLKNPTVECQSILSIDILINTQLTLDRHMISQLTVSQVSTQLYIDQKLVDYSQLTVD